MKKLAFRPMIKPLKIVLFKWRGMAYKTKYSTLRVLHTRNPPTHQLQQKQGLKLG